MSCVCVVRAWMEGGVIALWGIFDGVGWWCDDEMKARHAALQRANGERETNGEKTGHRIEVMVNAERDERT